MSRLRDIAISLKTLSAKENIPYADQFSVLVDFWAANKPMENIANTITSIQALVAAKPDFTGVEHLKAFLDAWAKMDKQPVSMMGDAVHPGPTGQLTMAAALLTELNAPGLVSKAAIDATTGKTGETAQCKIDNVKVNGDALSFDRLDDSLPFPIPDNARPATTVFAKIGNLSQYLLDRHRA